MLQLLAGCTSERPGTEDSETPAVSSSEPPTAPETLTYSDETAVMAGWDGACPAVNLQPLTDRFTDVESVDYRSDTQAVDQVTAWSGQCKADFYIRGALGNNDVYLVIEAFDTNVLAFEHYHDFAAATAERFSDAPIDEETELEDQSPWHASRITAQETPTVQSEQRVMATAALLGDFYTVEILVRFKPGEVHEADCEPAGAAECAMTATLMAEFLATSGYLDELHADIEAAIDGGM